jgi:hypothetical protein
MANLTTSADIDAFLAAADYEAARALLGADLLAKLSAAEIAITNASTTLTIGRMHALKATSANQTNALPAASGNAGKLIGVRITPDTTKIVTLDGNSSETIDGATTRPMWAGESAILLCDGSNWFKIAGESYAMSARMTRDASQSISNTTVTKILLDTVSHNFGLLADVSNNRFLAARAGSYRVAAGLEMDSATQANARLMVRIHVNGSSVGLSQEWSANSAWYLTPSIADVIPLAAGDYVEMHIYQDTGGSQNTSTSSSKPRMSVDELPQW